LKKFLIVNKFFFFNPIIFFKHLGFSKNPEGDQIDSPTGFVEQPTIVHERNPPLIFAFSRLNHNLDFSFLHVKNPIGDFSPTGFVKQPIKKTFLISSFMRIQKDIPANSEKSISIFIFLIISHLQYIPSM
ncbi:hypothetical protein, partial [uncultured Granulicatella sp.]|uniref:hypothetical protein n=1 Tax=uncultured Granulicatella sp. TaxID=316089 RepID=UPI0028D4F7CC